MSVVNIDVHAVWSTKFRQPFLDLTLRRALIEHINSNAKGKQIDIDRLDGSEDHIHCLLKLHPSMTISETIKLIKGESSWWINKLQKTSTRFEWGGGYYARSVSHWELDKIRSYIDGQEWHHLEQSSDKSMANYLRRSKKS